MSVTKLSKNFYCAECAAACEVKIKEMLHKEALVGYQQIVKDIYRDGETLFIEFQPNVGANDSNYVNAFADGFESGFLVQDIGF